MVRTLVTPERTVYSIESEDALKVVPDSRRPRIDAKQEGNLCQLLGFDRTANGGPHHKAEKHFHLEDDRETRLLTRVMGRSFLSSGRRHKSCSR